MFNLSNLNNAINNNDYSIYSSYNDNDLELALAFTQYIMLKNINTSTTGKHTIRNDYMFKKIVKENARHKCQITGVDGIVCEVAHILPFSKCKNNLEKYDPCNAIYLDCTIHRLLDKTNFISIVSDGHNYYMKINTDNIPNNDILQLLKKSLNICNSNNKVKIKYMTSASEYYINQMY